MKGSAAPMASPDQTPIMSQRAAHEDLRKNQQIKELQNSVNCFQGKTEAICKLSKSELSNIKDQLVSAQTRIEALLVTKTWS